MEKKTPAKRKRMENLVDWGEVDEVGKKPESADINKWMVSRESVLSWKESGLKKHEEPASKRMKRLELEFVGGFTKFTRAEPEVIGLVEDDPATPKGWKAGTLTSSTLVRKKSLKQIQKENTKITKWAKKVVVYEVNENDEERSEKEYLATENYRQERFQ